MNTTLIQQTWNSLSSHHHEVVEAFYDRLFARHPDFKRFFDQDRMARQMDKMVNTLAVIACYADSNNLIGPRLDRIGLAHAHYGISDDELAQFADTLLDVLGEYCARYNPGGWTADCERAWRAAFDTVVLPRIEQRLH